MTDVFTSSQSVPICHEPLSPNIPREEILVFDSVWCRAYFKLSGDSNYQLHTEEGAAVVQGMAILTRLGAVISHHMPGYMVAKTSEIRFQKPVIIGDHVRMTMLRLNHKESAAQVKVTLEHMSGAPITEIVMLLIRT